MKVEKILESEKTIRRRLSCLCRDDPLEENTYVIESPCEGAVKHLISQLVLYSGLGYCVDNPLQIYSCDIVARELC